jgi:glycosyltransferase involved in cell wall biosynthesis
MYLAVLPRYRTSAIAVLRQLRGDSLEFYCAPAHLDPTVRTGIPSEWFGELRIWRMFGRRAYLLGGHFRQALFSRVCILDFNPRSLSTWLIVALRLPYRNRRTLVWGHLFPQSGQGSSTARLRRTMRRLADGVIVYVYSDRDRALAADPRGIVFVAPNSLYREAEIARAGRPGGAQRRAVVYVGRLEPQKKVSLLVRGFALWSPGVPEARLVIVGNGSEREELETLAQRLDLGGRVEFRDWTYGADELEALYETAFCSGSPGFAGLGLTQSLGFGVPMAVARDEPHSPEIELADSGGVAWFDQGDEVSLSHVLDELWQQRGLFPRDDLSAYVADKYSSERMARGLASALDNVRAEEGAR